MSDEPVRTRVRTPAGWLSFQEYFVREKAMVEVRRRGVRGRAGGPARAGRRRDAIRGADLIVVCPSNPVTSIGPILAVPGIVRALADGAGARASR